MEELHTAGRYVSEVELRTFAKCSQRWAYEREEEVDQRLEIITNTLERVIVDCMKSHNTDPYQFIPGALSRALTNSRGGLLSQEIRDIQDKTTLWVANFYDYLRPDKYIPVLGPIDPVVRVSKTPIQLHISGMYRSIQNQTLHAVSIVPFSKTHDFSNDVPSWLKVKILQPFVSKHFATKRPQAKLHLFGMNSKSYELCYGTIDSNSLTNNYIGMIDKLVKQMEAGFHFPLVPCKHSCRFKDVCKPGTFTNAIT